MSVMRKLAGGGNLDVGEPNLPTYTQPDIVGDLHISGKLYINDTEYVPGQTTTGNWAVQGHDHDDHYTKLRPLATSATVINNPIGQLTGTLDPTQTLDELLAKMLDLQTTSTDVVWTAPTLEVAPTIPNQVLAFSEVEQGNIALEFTVRPGTVNNGYDGTPLTALPANSIQMGYLPTANSSIVSTAWDLRFDAQAYQHDTNTVVTFDAEKQWRWQGCNLPRVKTLNTAASRGKVRFNPAATTTLPTDRLMTGPTTFTFATQVRTDHDPSTPWEDGSWLPQANWRDYNQPFANQVIMKYTLQGANPVIVHHSASHPFPPNTAIMNVHGHPHESSTGVSSPQSNRPEAAVTLPVSQTITFKVSMPFYLIDNDPAFYKMDGSTPTGGWKYGLDLIHSGLAGSSNQPNLLQQFVLSAYGSSGFAWRNWIPAFDNTPTAAEINSMKTFPSYAPDCPLINDVDGSVPASSAWALNTMHIQSAREVENWGHYAVSDTPPSSPGANKQTGITNTPLVHWDTGCIELKMLDVPSRPLQGFRILWVPARSQPSNTWSSRLTARHGWNFSKVSVSDGVGQNYEELTNRWSLNQTSWYSTTNNYMAVNPNYSENTGRDAWIVHDVPNPYVWKRYTSAPYWQFVNGMHTDRVANSITDWNSWLATNFDDMTPMGSLVWLGFAVKDLYLKFEWD